MATATRAERTTQTQAHDKRVPQRWAPALSVRHACRQSGIASKDLSPLDTPPISVPNASQPHSWEGHRTPARR